MFNFFRKNKPQNVAAAAIISIAALIGMVDAFYLLLEFIQVLLHPGEPTPCTVNTIVSCTLTVQGKYGHYFPGIPNPMWGMLWYAGCLGYGVTRLFGSSFARPARMFVATVMTLGLIFSYRLYLASVLELGGVCPFCLISTTMSTLICLSFVVDDRTYADRLFGAKAMHGFRAFQVFSVLVFVIGLPLFLARGIGGLDNPIVALTHWSFPVMVAVILIMAGGHMWAYRQTRK